MSLFAEADNTWLVFTVIVIGLIIYYGHKAHMYFYRPEQWESLKKAEMEQKTAAENARREQRNKMIGGVAGGVARALLGGVFKNKHN